MKIISIIFGKSVTPLKQPFVTALRRVEHLESIVVKVESDSGMVGYGETAPTEAITGENVATILHGLTVLEKALMGIELVPLDQAVAIIHTSLEGHPNARAAMEIALYDLAAQTAGVPLVVYLGGSVATLQTGVTISLGAVSEMVGQARQALDDGFDSLKIKLGSNPQEDIERVTAIHAAVGDRARLKLDANQGWQVQEAIGFLNSIEDKQIPIELIEQPLPRRDLAGMATVRRHTNVPVMLDESVFTPADVLQVIEYEAADIINIKLDKSGGISQALKIADLCADAGISCMMGCMLEGAISVGAAAHVAAARPETITLIDLDAPMLCAASPVNGGVVFDPPSVVISPSPGLGVKGISGTIWY